MQDFMGLVKASATEFKIGGTATMEQARDVVSARAASVGTGVVDAYLTALREVQLVERRIAINPLTPISELTDAQAVVDSFLPLDALDAALLARLAALDAIG